MHHSGCPYLCQIAGNLGRGVGGLGGDGYTGSRGLWEGGACSGKSREMENIVEVPPLGILSLSAQRVRCWTSQLKD
jgi:hypothetical protein